MGQQGGVSQGDVSQAPDHQARRGSHCRRPAQDEEGAVQDGAQQHLPHLGRPEGRHFQGKGGGYAPQQGFGQEPGDQQGAADAQHHHPGEQQGAQ